MYIPGTKEKTSVDGPLTVFCPVETRTLIEEVIKHSLLVVEYVGAALDGCARQSKVESAVNRHF